MENNRLALQLNEQMLCVLTGNPKTNARMRDQVYLHVIIRDLYPLPRPLFWRSNDP